MRRLSLTVALLACLSVRVLAEDKKRGETPEDSYKAMMECILEGKPEGAWDYFSAGSRAMMAEQMGKVKEHLKSLGEAGGKQAAEELGITLEDLDKLTNEEIAKKMAVAQFRKIAEDDEAKAKMKGTKFKSAEIKEDRAVCVTVEPDGTEETIVMLKEDGIWRLDLPETDKAKKAQESEDEGEEDEEK